MGFPPRRLVLPDLKLRLPVVQEALSTYDGYGPPKPIAEQNLRACRYKYIVNFENGIKVHKHPIAMTEFWYFHETPDDFQFKRAYSFMYDVKHASVSEKNIWKYYTHPDFNEDGSFKRSPPC